MWKNSKKVYACGLATTGSFGIKNLIKSKTSPEIISKPTKISYFSKKKISKISSGFGFSLFGTTNKLYGSGLNNFYQLGKAPVKKGYKEKVPDKWYVHPKEIILPEGCGNIQHISSGRLHSLILTDSGVYGMGDNVHGQCGFDNNKVLEEVLKNKKYDVWKKIELDTDEEIRKVHCILDTSYILTKSGKLYGFGLGEDGQVGNEKYGVFKEPTLIGGDLANENIVNISGSTDTLIALSSKGDIFLWGQNEYNQMDLITNNLQLNIPKHFPLNIGKIISIAATGSSCIVCTEKGQVYVWGQQILGLGPRIISSIKPIQIDSVLFSPTGKKEVFVKSVFAGSTSMGARTNEGNLFTWGFNRYGELGLGKKEKQLFPYPVFLPEEVKSLDLGYDHTLFITN
ncbi:Williams-Beuren syndrome chromosomal region 16 protein [Strongyloides ratti]|uniref:Williams-Beuren syndrome chromosomal region 16 protein n=1 Tax=Strongyloides ratti TaxID=34506 RepID=A0A090L6D2_STRRB|nr:Williams-Beuren syndrome chromosomal region 16 protein [Strongyloides ratti]CEF65287.1 Williams-Beuren syndrome chromosomal region 16 protein [Strongyloides ratti]